MGKTRVRQEITVRAPIATVFERITDHEAMASWPGIQSCRLLREGETPNGLGAVREVKTRGLTLIEEVVQFEPPRRYDYTILRGLPVEHRGTVTLLDEGSAVRVVWEVRLASRVPFLAEIVGQQLRNGLAHGLAYFKRETERRAALAERRSGSPSKEVAR